MSEGGSDLRLRSLAQQEVAMGGADPPKDSLFGVALDALSSAGGDRRFGSPAHREIVCGQVYAAATDADPDDVERFVDDVVGQLSLESVDDAVDVPRRLRENYEGQFKLARDKTGEGR